MVKHVLKWILTEMRVRDGESGEFFNGNEFARLAGGKKWVRFLGRTGIIRYPG